MGPAQIAEKINTFTILTPVNYPKEYRKTDWKDVVRHARHTNNGTGPRINPRYWSYGSDGNIYDTLFRTLYPHIPANEENLTWHRRWRRETVLVYLIRKWNTWIEQDPNWRTYPMSEHMSAVSYELLLVSVSQIFLFNIL